MKYLDTKKAVVAALAVVAVAWGGLTRGGDVQAAHPAIAHYNSKWAAFPPGGDVQAARYTIARYHYNSK